MIMVGGGNVLEVTSGWVVCCVDRGIDVILPDTFNFFIHNFLLLFLLNARGNGSRVNIRIHKLYKKIHYSLFLCELRGVAA